MKTRSVLALSAAATLSAALVAVTAAAAKSAKPSELATASPPPAAVTLAQVKPVQRAPREEITGSLMPAKGLQLGFEVAGRLARLWVKKGSRVTEGQLLAQLNPEMADAQVQVAEAAVKAAEAQAGMAADVAARNAELQKTGSVSDLLGKSSAGAAASAQAQLKAAKAQLALARASRRRQDLRAPFAGTLIDAPDQVGAAVTSSSLLFSLEALDPLVLKLTVSEAARAQLKPLSRVQVEAVGSSGATADAFVRVVIPSADPATRRIPVEVQVPNPDGRFTAHTLARALLPLGDAESAQSLPATALSSGGGDHVFILGASSEVRRVPVQVLDRGALEVVVTAPELLTRVVNYPSADLAEGTKVSVK